MNAGGRKIKVTANQSGSEEFEPTMLGLVIFALNFTLGGHVRELEAPVKGFPSQLAVEMIIIETSWMQPVTSVIDSESLPFCPPWPAAFLVHRTV